MLGVADTPEKLDAVHELKRTNPADYRRKLKALVLPPDVRRGAEHRALAIQVVTAVTNFARAYFKKAYDMICEADFMAEREAAGDTVIVAEDKWKASHRSLYC